MNDAWLNWVGSGLLTTIIIAAAAAYQERQKRKAVAPREDAETDEVIVRRVTKENERLANRLEAQDEKIEALAAAAEKAQAAADTAKALSRQQGERIDELERKQASAVRFIAKLITDLPTTTVIHIPEDLVADVEPHIKRPRWAADPQPPAEEPSS